MTEGYDEYDSFAAWKKQFGSAKQNKFFTQFRPNTPFPQKGRVASTNTSSMGGIKLDEQCQPTKCYHCNCVYHLERACPYNPPKNIPSSSKDYGSYIADMNNEDDVIEYEYDIAGILKSRIPNFAILDTGFPKIVSGVTWNNSFIECLDDDTKKR